MQTSSNQNVSPAHNQIEQIARSLWQKAGQPQNRDLEFWLKAENQLKSGQNGQGNQTQNPQPEAFAKREEQPRASSMDVLRSTTPKQSRRDRKLA